MKKILIKLIVILFTTLFLLGNAAPSNIKTEDERIETVSSVLEDFPLWWEDARLEDPEDREERIELIAAAQIDIAHELTCTGKYDTPDCDVKFHADYRKLVGLLVTAGFWETRYSKRIQMGDCRKKGEKLPLGGVSPLNECDNGKARGVYQVQKNGTYPDELWENAEGLDWESNRNATMAAGLTFAAAWRRCHKDHGIYGVWGAYAIGKCKTVDKGVKRAKSYQKKMWVLDKELPPMIHTSLN